MSLREARRIAKRETKAGRKVEIRDDRPACKRRRPDMHPMSGGEVVVDVATGEYIWN